jgi:hypothetical protein
MRRTDRQVAPRGPVDTSETLQVFTIRISPGDASGLSWPLHVYGVIAARDLVDYKRNIIFQRGRDDYHTITEQVCVFCSSAICCLYFNSEPYIIDY